jgi:hypothetical protein
MAGSLTRAGFRRLAFGVAVAVLAGCAAMAPPTPELTVRQRAAENWKHRQAGDFDKAYMFMPPSYRAVTPVATYRRVFSSAAQVLGAEVEQVVCETEDKCVATIKLDARMPGPRASPAPLVTYYEEVWVRENGQWWLFPTQ